MSVNPDPIRDSKQQPLHDIPAPNPQPKSMLQNLFSGVSKLFGGEQEISSPPLVKALTKEEQEIENKTAILIAKFFKQSPDFASPKHVRDDTKTSSKDLEVIKQLFRTIVILAADNKKANIEFKPTEIPLRDGLYIRAKLVNDDLQIETLFGQVLGAGSFGAALKAMNVSAENVEPSGQAVKVAAPSGAVSAKKQEKANKDLKNEIKIVKLIHGNKEILGVQSNMEQVGTAAMHVGPQYNDDLFKLLHRTQLSTNESLSLGYQMLHGLKHSHAKGITHGDLKPANIFVKADDQLTHRLFIGDWGGAIHHHTDSIKKTPTFTTSYRFEKDFEMRYHFTSLNDKIGVTEIDKKSDVASACIVICELLRIKVPRNQKPNGLHTIDAIQRDLLMASLAIKCDYDLAWLIVRGFDSNALQRPNIDELLVAVAKYLQSHDPDTFKHLKELSIET